MAIPNFKPAAEAPAPDQTESGAADSGMVTISLPIDVLNSFIDVLTEARDQAQGAPEEQNESDDEKQSEQDSGLEGMGDEMSKSVRPPMQSIQR